MKAFQLTSYDGPAALRCADVPVPEPSDDELLVDVEAIGVNFPDLLLTRGEYQFKPALPTVPGCEIAGRVAWAPDNTPWKIGDRISAFIWSGGFAEKAVVPAATASRVPDGVRITDAAAMVVNYQTAMFAIERRGELREGEKVLVLGAAGGIGTAAIQVAKGSSATVVAGVANADQSAVALAAGADDVVVLEEGYSSTVRELVTGGVDMVVDPLGDWLFDEALRCLEPEGRVIVIGFAAGSIPSIAANRLLLRNVTVVGAAFGAFLDREPELVAHQARRLAELGDRGIVLPQVDTVFAFDDLPDALERLARGEVRGKSVVAL